MGYQDSLNILLRTVYTFAFPLMHLHALMRVSREDYR